ncbi:MAG: type II toxin-antitoxin system prevent-host-death family antitoxin [Thermoleophilia bacterium]|nr:type II toxin-antitoxin system prevent-host-death family antitoxin [Thermoleophilia bacterium]
MAQTVGIGEAKTNLSKLVRRAEAGEEIVVCRGREPVARIVPLERKRGGVRGRGSMKGEIWMVPDKEMKEVDREIEQMFEESEIFPGESSPSGQD